VKGFPPQFWEKNWGIFFIQPIVQFLTPLGRFLDKCGFGKRVKKVFVLGFSINLSKRPILFWLVQVKGLLEKFALIEEDNIKAIFADFTQRIGLKNYNPRLAYYYFRSDLFQYLIYTYKKGLGNNTNIFPSQIQEFPIPNWSKEKQIDIVKKIESK